MTNDQFENKFENGELEDEYAEYVMDNCHGDRIICNGDTLISALEELYLFDSFKDSLVTE